MEKEENDKTRIEFIDLFRGFGIIIMIMGHIGFGSRFDYFIHAFNMPMFFIVSGIFFKRPNPSRKLQDLKNFLIRKYNTLLIPYIFWGMIQYLIWLINNKEVCNFYLPLKSLFWINDSATLGYPNSLWFITALFFAELIYEVVLLITTDKHVQRILIIIVSFFGNIERQYCCVRLPWSLGAACTGVGLLFIGNIIRNLYEDMRLTSMKNKFEILNRLFSCNALQVTIEALIASALIYLNRRLSAETINMRLGQYGIIPLFWINAVSASVVGLKISFICKRIKIKFLVLLCSFIQKIGEFSLLFVALNQIILTILDNFVTFSVISILGKILILMITIIVISIFKHLLEKLGFGFALGKKCAFNNKFGIYVTFAVLITAIVSTIIIESVSCPSEKNLTLLNEVQAPTFTTNTIDNDMLLSILQNNIDYLAFSHWNESVSEYAFRNNSNTTMALKNNNWQKKELKKSRKSFADWKNQNYLYIANSAGCSSENTIRPLAHKCLIIASNVFFGICNNTQIKELTQKCTKLVASLAKKHISNFYQGWGNSWQSALWAENIGFSAWLLWENFSITDKEYIAKMVEYEANKILNSKILFFADSLNHINYPGDTKSEENAWNSRILALAVCMFPQHKSKQLWEDKLNMLLLASTATPKDSEIYMLDGYNLNPDGTVINHNKLHLDYMNVTIEGMIDTIIIYKLANKAIPKSSYHNFDLIYDALVNLELCGYEQNSSMKQHFYVRDNNEHATYNLYMPQANDWGGNWYASCYLTDVICDLLKLDKTCPENLKATDWANKHLEKIYTMVNDTSGKSKGCFFRANENYFVSGETYQMQCLIKAAILKTIL